MVRTHVSGRVIAFCVFVSDGWVRAVAAGLFFSATPASPSAAALPRGSQRACAWCKASRCWCPHGVVRWCGDVVRCAMGVRATGFFPQGAAGQVRRWLQRHRPAATCASTHPNCLFARPNAKCGIDAVLCCSTVGTRSTRTLTPPSPSCTPTSKCAKSPSLSVPPLSQQPISPPLDTTFSRFDGEPKSFVFVQNDISTHTGVPLVCTHVCVRRIGTGCAGCGSSSRRPSSNSFPMMPTAPATTLCR
jgi:hypothetical protein